MCGLYMGAACHQGIVVCPGVFGCVCEDCEHVCCKSEAAAVSDFTDD